jgi:hypothetical protein
MKTTYTVYESNGGGLHFFAYDNGQLNFYIEDWEPTPILNAIFDLLEGYTAEQLNSKEVWSLDEEDLEAAMYAAESYEQNPASTKRIADQNGLYFDKAGRAGEIFLHALQWHTDPESVFDLAFTFNEVTHTVQDIVGALELTSAGLLRLFEAATNKACDIACECENSDILENFADCIGECGKALGLLRHCQCEHFRIAEDGELAHCAADEAEERQLSFEFRSSDMRKNEQIESIISTYWPHDRHTEYSQTIYDRDGENVWQTWKYTR